MHLHASGENYCRKSLTPYRDLELTRSAVHNAKDGLVCAARKSTSDSRVMNQRVDYVTLQNESLKINNWLDLAK